MRSTHRMLAISSIVGFGLFAIAACTSTQPLVASSRCSDYLERSQDERQRSAAEVSVENQAADAGNPMQYLNADTYCARHPDKTLSDAVGKSLDQYRAEQQQSTEASAPPSVETYQVDEVTHLRNVCVPGQQTTKFVVSAGSGGSSEDQQIVVMANGRKVFDVNPRDITGASLAKLVTIPCKGPVEIKQLNATAFTGVSVFWPARPGDILSSTDTASTNGPPLLYPSAETPGGSGYYAIMDS